MGKGGSDWYNGCWMERPFYGESSSGQKGQCTWSQGKSDGQTGNFYGHEHKVANQFVFLLNLKYAK